MGKEVPGFYLDEDHNLYGEVAEIEIVEDDKEKKVSKKSPAPKGPVGENYKNALYKLKNQMDKQTP